MHTAVNLWPLLGIAVVVAGFLIRANPVLVVIAACGVTGAAAFMSPAHILESLGAAFIETRKLPLILLLPLAAIGLLERAGLKEHAQASIAKIRSATTGRLLTVYLLVREVAAAFGLTSLGGHPNMVRPLVAPMAEAAAEKRGPLDDDARQRIRANAAAVDTIALFFGEDLFIAIGSILLIRGVLAQSGILVTPTSIALWALPTAACALVVHGVRLWLLDRWLRAR